MNGKILVDGKMIRPSFNHADSRTYDAVSSQLLESIRNLLESCQMLQCDLAYAIKNTRQNTELLLREIRGLRRDIKAKGRKRP